MEWLKRLWGRWQCHRDRHCWHLRRRRLVTRSVWRLVCIRPGCKACRAARRP